ncbi:MAG TPA: DoxX family protein [Polyangiaceae bacterium]|nr:DoxX family protein [Polyangiaceae bacterium]
MQGKVIAYWVCTGIVAFAMIAGGIADMLLPEPVVKIFTHLGYPLYFGRILGIWKFLGGLAILAPKRPLLKEWAYAGIVFDLTGAACSHIYSGDGPADVLKPLVVLGFMLASYVLRPESRRLARAAS